MKNLVIAGSTAATIGIATLAGTGMTHEAHAAEQSQINYNELAQKAQANDASLQKPLQSGSYDYQFSLNGFDYHFLSDGTKAYYEYHQGNGKQATQTQNVNSNANVNTNTNANTNTNVNRHSNYKIQNQSYNYQTSQQSYTQQPKQMKQPQQSTSSKGSSAGTPAGMEAIVQRESGGDPTAVNPSSGAAGKYQFLQSTWDNVAPAQYKGVSPAKVPENVQDQVAHKLWNGGSGASHWAETV